MPKRIAITAVLLAALLVSLAASRVTSQPSERSSALTAEVEAKGTVRVIVHLETPFVPEDALPTDAHIMVQRQEIARVRALVRAGLRGTQHRVVREYDALPFLSLEVGPDALRMLESLQGVVVHVEKDELAAPMLAESIPLIQGDKAWEMGFDGTGQIVAILDTGVDKIHPFLAGKVVGEACFSSTVVADGSTSLCPGGAPSSFALDSALPCDLGSVCAHGTNVAGIAAGSGAEFSGVAKGAKILAIQVFSKFNSLLTCAPNFPPCVLTYQSDQLAALNHVFTVRNSFPGLKVASANLSAAGFPPFSSPCDTDSRKAAIDQLRGAGIATTLPAGNNGAVTTGAVNALSAPACISTSISVGATLDGSTDVEPPATPVDTVAAFSNTAPFLSLLAPGESINSSIPGGAFFNFRGTSQASAHVAGAFAVLRQASPSASVTTILQALQNTGVPITDTRANPAIVKPRINVRDAITVLPVLPSIQVVQFSAGLYTVSEATATATITLKRHGAAALVASTAFTVPVTVTPGTAVPNVDYVPPLTDPVVVAFAKGQTTASFTIKVLNDTLVDGDRLVNLTLGTPTDPTVLKGFPDTAKLKITNNDQGGVMKFALAASSVNEGGTAVVTVMRTGTNLASGVTVDFAVTGGTAVQPTDFTLANGTLTFGAGQASKTIPIPTVRDFLVGPAKTIVLTLSNAQGGGSVIVGPGATTTVTIKNIDVGGVMQFSSAIASVFENVPGGTFNLTVKRAGTSASLAGSVTVDYAVTGGTAFNNVDYVLASPGTVTFGPGETSKTIAVTINDGALINGNRTVIVTLSNPQGGGTLGTIKVATLTIVDDEQGVQFSAALYTVSEPGATATITLKRSGAPALVAQTAFTVPVTVAPDNAVPGADYVVPLGPPLGTVTVAFAKAQTTATFTIPLLNDTLVDGERRVNLALGTPTSPVLKGPQATAVLKLPDNDQGGVMKFSLAAYSVNEGGTAVVTVMRTGINLASAVSVDFAVTNVTAVQGTDFTLANGTLTFAAGQTSKTISIPTVRDNLVGPAKTFQLALSNAQGGGAVIVGPGATTTVTINNIDTGGVIKLDAAAYTVFEAEGGSTVTVKIMRTGTNLAGGVTVRLRSQDISATAPADYDAIDQIVAFGPGEILKTVLVSIHDDLLAEGDEKFSLTLDLPTGGATLAAPSTAIATIKDNEALVQFALASDQVVESLVSKIYTVTRSGGSTPVSVHWSTNKGASGTLNFTAIQTSATITVPIAADFSNLLPDGDRTLTLTLDTPGGGAQIGVNNPLNVTVHDDDVAFTAPPEPVASKGQFVTLSFCQLDRDNSSLCGGPAPTTNVSGGQPPYHFVKSAGSLPLGLTLHPNGNVDGTPTGAPGRYKFTLCAVDLAGKQSCKPTSILMVGIDGAYTGTFSGTVSGAVAFTVTTTDGGNGTVHVSLPSAATGTVNSALLTIGNLVTEGVPCSWAGGFTVNNTTGAVHASGSWSCSSGDHGNWAADKPAPAL